MPRAAALVALLLLALPFAGCLSDDAADDETETPVAQSATEAGAVSGDAPVAPKDSYVVEASDEGELVAYPVPIQTNPARSPVVVDLSGEFKPGDCRPLNFGPLEQMALQTVSAPRRFLDLSESVKVGDVFLYNITLTYTNAPDNWGEIHAGYGFGNTIAQHQESTREMTDVVISWEGQGFRASEDDLAWAFIGCGMGQMTRAIPYTFTVSLSFAEGAVPAEAPVLLPVPEGATRLIVRGVAIDGEEGVLSHFRLFAPDDTLVCECALSSADEVSVVPLAVPGDYVLLVDHTSNGFVSVALDVPPEAEMRALSAEWVVTPVFATDGGPVDTTVELDFERVPLFMAAFVAPKDGAGVGKKTDLTVTNTRGTPLHIAWGGHVTWEEPTGGGPWLGFWPGDWAFEQDHHAYAQGHHTAVVKAEELRGEVAIVTRQYVR